MSALVSTLYALRPRDEAQPLWSWVNFYQDTTGAANPVTSATHFPPSDKLWLITNVYGLAKGVAATTIAESVRFFVINSGGGIAATIAGERVNPPLAAGASMILHKKVEIVLDGDRTGIQSRFGFDAANAGNQVQWSFSGYEIPRGNILG